MKVRNSFLVIVYQLCTTAEYSFTSWWNVVNGCVKFYLKSLVIDINYHFHNLISRLKTCKNKDQTQISLLSCLKSLLLISIAPPHALPLTYMMVRPARKLYYSMPYWCMDYVPCSLSHKHVTGCSGYSFPSLKKRWKKLYRTWNRRSTKRKTF